MARLWLRNPFRLDVPCSGNDGGGVVLYHDGETCFKGIIKTHLGFLVAIIKNSGQLNVGFSRVSPEGDWVRWVEWAKIFSTVPT